jgi:hypothetical protein
MSREHGNPVGRYFRLPPLPRSTIRPIAELLKESPFHVATAMISNHVAVITLAHQLPPMGPLVHDALDKEARRLLREQPAKGPISAIEVLAPRPNDARSAIVFREELDKPFRIPPRPVGNGEGTIRRYLVSRSVAFQNRSKTNSDPAHPSSLSGRASPLLQTLFIPRPLRERLNARKIDVTASLPVFTEAILREAGFSTRTLHQREKSLDLEATFQTARVLVRCHSCQTKVPASMVDRFGYDFLLSHYDEGLFVSDGFLSYGVFHWERDRRIHLVGRLSFQRLINSIASRILRSQTEGQTGS